MINRYIETDIMTASPTNLVVKLYEAALRSAFEARASIEAGLIQERGQAIQKALAIVAELQSSLDFEKGGAIASQLHDLYAFIIGRMLEANISGSTMCIDEAVRVLETLLEAWHEIARNPAATAAAVGAAP